MAAVHLTVFRRGYSVHHQPSFTTSITGTKFINHINTCIALQIKINQALRQVIEQARHSAPTNNSLKMDKPVMMLIAGTAMEN